jgi:parvulin-like peptidyl-prolyl isomerase
MKLFRFTICFASLALIASAAPVYKVTLTESAVLAGSVMKAGDCRIVVNGDKATLTSGKTTLEVPVKVETGSQNFRYTAVECSTEAGKNMLDDIQVGGTATTLVFKR